MEEAKEKVILDYVCPHCHQDLTQCDAPPIHIGDGLGWGCETMYICLNDDCPLFVNGWKFIENQFGHFASYRYMRTPDSNEGISIMVGSRDAFRGCIVNNEQLSLENDRYTKEKEALAKLDTCVAEKNLAPVLYLILDEAASPEGRERACALLTELNDLAAFEPIRNHKFKNSNIEQRANLAVNELLKANFKKECPYCAEVIQTRAKICKHCNKEI